MSVDAIAHAAQVRARLWNLMLGGNEAYELERSLLGYLESIAPDIAKLALAERAFIDRSWRFVTGLRGVRQVVHIGAPLPAGHPPHRALAAPGRVVYVEGDELLAAKGSAWLPDRNADVVRADPGDPARMVDTIGGRIDWDEPIAVIAPGFLQWRSEGQARTWVIEVAEQLPRGSYIAATHLHDPERPGLVALIERLISVLDGYVGAGWFRRRSKIEDLFPGLLLETPGVRLAAEWWANGPRFEPLSPCEQLVAGVVAAVPRSP
jgi:hypothetical protein